MEYLVLGENGGFSFHYTVDIVYRYVQSKN